MKKFPSKSAIFSTFFIWRAGLFLIAYLSVYVIPEFGGRFPYYQELLIKTGLPSWFWGFGNFDGVHYLTIAMRGYLAEFTQVFFPLYPLLIKLLVWLFSIKTQLGFFLVGFAVSNLFFLFSLFLLTKLFRLDYSREDSLKAIILITAFPTSFYFGSIYTESLFLALVLLTFIFLRKGNFLAAGFFASFASATRILGFFLFFVIIIELYLKIARKGLSFKGKKALIYTLSVLISPLGLISYMVYLQYKFNNPIFFLTAQEAFGAERNSQPFILLPQVVYRYIKILLTVNPQTPQFFNAFLELFFSSVVLFYLVIFFKKIRFSYWFFTFCAFLIPTLTGTFSSMPRYVLMCFLLIPPFVIFTKRYFKLILLGFIIIQAILVSLFVRGYWIA